jgi:hypothetical protein|nr:MAG TPA: hypothetical protein [Caudoviricetes sp.]
MDIITGYVGSPHVTAEQDRDINIGIFGEESYVLRTGSRLKAEVSSNNEIKIRDGVIMHQGCAASIKKNTYDSLTIVNGSQGMKRIDLIVARYSRNQSTKVESLTLKVIQGTPVTGTPSAPGYTTGDIQAGDLVADMPLYQVVINGLNITEVKQVFNTVDTVAELNGKLEKKTDTTTLGFGVSETFTGQYLNSKPIYQKMISVGALPNNTTKSISTGITGADYIWVDMENSFAFNSGASYPIPYVDPKTVANSIGVRITNNGATVIVSTGTNWSTYSGGITLRYTKK